jgi:hypothetical protein
MYVTCKVWNKNGDQNLSLRAGQKIGNLNFKHLERAFKEIRLDLTS